VVERIIQACGRPIRGLIGDSGFLRGLKARDFADQRFGLPTVQDILGELEKPGRDPRPEFKTASFLEGVEDLKDLRPDMVLEGTATNVTNFGVFVDIGVHQDGLVHISAMSDQFVKDPHSLVKAGDLVRVKVLEVDLARRRIALTMRLADRADRADRADTKRPGADGSRGAARPGRGSPARNQDPRPAAPPAGGAMAEALARALKAPH